MMKRFINQLIILFGLICLVACSDGDDPVPDPEPIEEGLLESIRLHIGASGTVETRAYGGDENAVEGEFIHKLRIFIVDENNIIEKAILANDSLNSEQTSLAEVGNLTQFSTVVDLTPGKKTIYAFANMDYAKIDGQEALLENVLKELDEGEEWDKKIDDYGIIDPAGEINTHLNEKRQPANDYYIPMSVLREVDLTTDGQVVDIALVRLVSKIQASIMNRQGSAVTISRITMGSFHQKVALFENGIVEDAGDMTYDQELSLSVPSSLQEATELPVFYINETTKDGDEPFVITLMVNDAKMSGETRTTSIPRNHVLPLTLGLSNVTLDLKITAQVAPIGGYPVNVVLSGPTLTDVYHVNLPEGCIFSISGIFQPDLGDPISSSLTVTLPEPTNIVHIETNNGSEVTGRVTALSEQEVTLMYTAQADALRETGNLIIHTVSLQNGTDYPAYSGSQTRAAEWCAAPRWYEPVFLMKNEE